jgi:3-hydroxyisobutyrate dehydrogenase-like beta-hydroxyacid dehydrogenase
MAKVGLVGAGLMGRGIARNVLKAGYPLVVHKRNPAALDERGRELAASGARITGDVDDVFRSCEVLLLCLPSSIEVEHVIAALEASASRTVRRIIDFSTARPASTRAIHGRLAAAGIRFVDAPMTGGPKQADEASLSLAVGATPAEAADVAPLLGVLAKNIVYAGSPGAGNVAKLLNNFLSILDRSAASCVALLAQDSGLPLATVRDFVGVSGGFSRGFQTEIDAIMDGRFPLGFALELALKDLRYAAEVAQASGRSFALLEELLTLFNAAATAGYGKKDLNAVYQYLASASRKG